MTTHQGPTSSLFFLLCRQTWIRCHESLVDSTLWTWLVLSKLKRQALIMVTRLKKPRQLISLWPSWELWFGILRTRSWPMCPIVTVSWLKLCKILSVEIQGLQCLSIVLQPQTTEMRAEILSSSVKGLKLSNANGSLMLKSQLKNTVLKMPICKVKTTDYTQSSMSCKNKSSVEAKWVCPWPNLRLISAMKWTWHWTPSCKRRTSQTTWRTYSMKSTNSTPNRILY
jgi:hypothetical protein